MKNTNKCLNCKVVTKNPKFCSLSCSSSFNMKILLKKKREKKIAIYEKNPKRCKHCNKKIPYHKKVNKFCSHSCATTVVNKGVRRHGKSPGKCLNCGCKTASYLNKFCSHKCSHEKKYKEYIEEWFAGRKDGVKGGGVSNHIRKYLFKKHNNKCQKCSWAKINKYTNNLSLTVHHKDGNWKNNKPNNLELLCPNCHSLTKNYKIANKGSGRVYRRRTE